MDFCGIICEFNPFHNGHKYLIDQAKKITNSKILCLMSGNFMQRGTAASDNKYDRARAAISCGANCVLELPTVYACSNAENFALGAVKILGALGVKQLAFGVENTDISVLEKIAELKLENSERFTLSFKNEIENGVNYNCALKRAIVSALGEEARKVIDKPNNILAIEYLTAIKKLHLSIEPIAISRCDNGYFSRNSKDEFLSASGIRELAENGKNYEKYIPKNAKTPLKFDKNCEKTLNFLKIEKIRELPATALEKFYDYSEGIEYRIKKVCETCGDYAEITDKISSVRYRKARVEKLMLYPVLGITKLLLESAKKSKPVSKVLAVDKSDKELLSSFDKRKINLIVTNKDYDALGKIQSKVIDVDLRASTIYTTVTLDRKNLDKKAGTLFLYPPE